MVRTGRAAIVAVVMTVSGACSRGGSSTTTATTAQTTTTATSGASGSMARLPIGDGKVSSTARRDYVMACDTGEGPGGGALRDGPWIKSDKTWVPGEKPHVQGAVSWPQAAFAPSLLGAQRVITGNGLPLGITTGAFPVQSSDPAHRYDPNPNTIKATPVNLSLPAQPVAGAAPSCLGRGPIGIFTDGVYLFDALDGQNRDAPAHEVLDSCGGHPERQGTYHYHSLPDCFASTVGGRPAQVGWALDGFGIFVESKPDLSPFTNADLDECHGRTSNITWDGKDVSMYHYVVTAAYPYTLGCYRGTPSSSSPPG